MFLVNDENYQNNRIKSFIFVSFVIFFRCVRVRTLRGIMQPITLEMIDDYRCVVLCKRELRTYNLDTGTLLTTLKGKA